MIIKTYELNKINNKIKFFLLYGNNNGFKDEIIKNFFENKFKKKIYRYDESEILHNKENFYNIIFTKSLFEDEKLIIISRVSDKIKDIINEVIEKEIDDTTIILNSNNLDKKSKLRSLFEKNKRTVCIPFYEDNSQTLSSIASSFFKEKKIPISQETINLLIERCRGDRLNLKNELNKIESFIKDKNKIDIEDILKLTNLAENYNVAELIDNCLAKNPKKITTILNENNFSIEDCILIMRTLLAKTKRLHKLKKESQISKNIDNTISSFRPIIFWKDKNIVKQQIEKWPLYKIENLIYEINEIELLVKKNSHNSLNIVSDFIINQSN